MYIHHVPSGEVGWVINLRNARVDTEPPVQSLLGGGGAEEEEEGDRVGNIWAVYGSMNTWLFRARSERDKAEWVLAIDEAFVLGGE